jgi:glycosyltransferase involved in cell wall biosynthesis
MGSGTRLKILEAMAAGCAVVATPHAASGLGAEARRAMVVTEGRVDMARAIVSLLQSSQKRESLGQAAKAFVTRHHDWAGLIPKLLDAYREIGLG